MQLFKEFCVIICFAILSLLAISAMFWFGTLPSKEKYNVIDSQGIEHENLRKCFGDGYIDDNGRTFKFRGSYTEIASE